MPRRPTLALFPLVAIFLYGCSGGVPDNEPSTVDVESHKTPEEVFEAAIAAAERDDWESLASMLTAESQALAAEESSLSELSTQLQGKLTVSEVAARALAAIAETTG